jgi:hypothetical protein
VCGSAAQMRVGRGAAEVMQRRGTWLMAASEGPGTVRSRLRASVHVLPGPSPGMKRRVSTCAAGWGRALMVLYLLNQTHGKSVIRVLRRMGVAGSIAMAKRPISRR